MPEAGLLAALVAGLVGSTHCLGMCGGIAGALGVAAKGRGSLVVAYSAGRIASYAAAGAIVGAIGAGLAGLGPFGPVLRIVMGVAFILLGLQVALGLKLLAPLEAAGAKLWARLSPAARRFMPPRHAGQALALGALWGWLPCGLVYGMLAAAAGAGSAGGGALVMAAFGLGTAPAMIGVGWASGRGSGLLTARRKRALGWVLVLFGAWTLVTPMQFFAGGATGGHGHHHPPAAEAPAPVPGDPAEAFARLEARLAAAPRIALAFSTVSTGAFESRLDGRLSLEAGRAQLEASGSFGGEPAALSLEEHGGRLAGGNGPLVFDEPAAPATREALLVGWTRMGILHNLARLTAGQPPDRAAGGATEWVTVHDLRWGEPGMRGGRAARPLALRIRVGGQDSGEATLWIAEANGLPVEREQTVRFPGGEMQVVETYRDVVVGE